MLVRSSIEVIFNLSCPSTTSTSFLQHVFFVISNASESLASPQHESIFENTAISTKVSPQKCFSTVKESVENNTKKDSAIAMVLFRNEYFTLQSYKIDTNGNDFIKSLTIKFVIVKCW